MAVLAHWFPALVARERESIREEPSLEYFHKAEIMGHCAQQSKSIMIGKFGQYSIQFSTYIVEFIRF